MRLASGINNRPTGTIDTMDTNFTNKSLNYEQAWASWVANTSAPMMIVGKWVLT